MTIRRRLIFSFVTILVLFGLNLVIYFWGNHRRQATVEDLRRAVRRQLLISSVHEGLDKIQKQISLLSQGVSDTGSTTAPPGEVAQFQGQLVVIAGQTGELRELTDTAERAAVDGFAKSYATLSASWTSAFADLGVNHSRAIAE